MDLFDQTDWSQNLKVIIDQYQGRKLPLNYSNNYELLIVVLLAAQDSDANINLISIPFFEKYNDFESITKANEQDLLAYLKNVKNHENKTKWIIEIAHQLKNLEVPRIFIKLTQLIGIGRKSANVILRENKIKPTGIIVDLHVIRVSFRLGISTNSEDGNKTEQQLMLKLSYDIWNEVGMALSFLGREICRATNPQCDICLLKLHCAFYNNGLGE